MIKRICSVILVFCMVLGGVNALAYEDVKTEKQQMAVELVTGLGIMSPESDTTFGEKTLVKRGEFALYATQLMGYDVTAQSTSKGYFEDVDTATIEGAAVDLLVSMNVIPKSGREYNPNDEITYVEAVRILLNCLGYSRTASFNGGFPGGYIKTATECELNKNMSMMTNSVLKKTDVALLLYNALFVYPMEYNNNNYTKSEKTLLEKARDVHETTGIVMGYENTYIGNSSLSDNSVEIDGVVYDAGTTNIGDYVGYSVKAYYSQDDMGGQTIVAFAEKINANKVNKFTSDDFEVSGNKVTYYVNNSKKNLKISSSAAVIYNGRYYTEYEQLEDVLNISEGDVTFIANNSSSSVNVIKVNDVKHLLVERVDVRNGRLYLKNGSPTQDTVPYLADVVTVASSDIDATVYLDGEEIEFKDIKANDAITMEKTLDGDEVTLYVSRNVVSGKINSISEDKISIGGTKYDVSSYCANVYNIGTNGDFAITTDGKFLGLVEVIKGGDNDYAYVRDVYCEVGPNKAYIELYTAGGELKTFECSSNMKVNGTKRAFDEIPQYVLKSELVTYKSNSDGMITQLNRPFDASSKFDYINETQFIKNWNKSSVRYIDGIMGMSFITDDTTIFKMPRFDRDNPSDYQIISKDDLTNRTYADVTCYDVDRQGRAGVVLIVEDFSDTVEMGSDLFFVKETMLAVNDDDEPICRITGYQHGEEVTLDFTENTSSVTYEDGWMNYVGNEDFDTGYNNLKVGDAIQYSLDNVGCVGAYRLVYNNEQTIYNSEGELVYDDPNNFFEDWSGTGAVTKQDFYDDLYIGFGDVQLRYMDYMVMLGLNEHDRSLYESSSSPIRIIDYYRPINLLNASIYVYNVNKDELEIGDMEDVLKSDIVFTRSKKMGETNEVMVYVEE